MLAGALLGLGGDKLALTAADDRRHGGAARDPDRALSPGLVPARAAIALGILIGALPFSSATGSPSARPGACRSPAAASGPSRRLASIRPARSVCSSCTEAADLVRPHRARRLGGSGLGRAAPSASARAHERTRRTRSRSRSWRLSSRSSSASAPTAPASTVRASSCRPCRSPVSASPPMPGEAGRVPRLPRWSSSASRRSRSIWWGRSTAPCSATSLTGRSSTTPTPSATASSSPSLCSASTARLRIDERLPRRVLVSSDSRGPRQRMRSLDCQVEYWNDVGSSKTFAHPPNLARLARHLSLESRILDYGCGYGRVLGVLDQQGYSDLIGVDPAPAMIARRAAGTRTSHSNSSLILPPSRWPTNRSTRCCSSPCSPAYRPTTASAA